MAEIKVLKVVDGDYTENDSATDSIKLASILTANYELTDTKLGKLVDGADAADEHIHDARYFTETEHINSSVGAPDSGKPVRLNASGEIDASMLPTLGVTDHGALTGLGDIEDHTGYIELGGTRAFTGPQSMGSNKITSLADGTATTDAVNYGQLQSVVAGIDLKEAVEYATTAALPTFTGTGTGTLTFSQAAYSPDGTPVVNGDRILVKDEAAADIDHGIFDVSGVGSAVVLTRSSDADTSAEVTSGMFVFVKGGTANGNTGWAIITADPITLETTPIQFSQFQGLPSYTASLGVELSGVDFRADLLASGGLKLVGNEIAVEPNDFAGEGLVDAADDLAIDWSTAFNDAKAIKASDLGSTATGFGASLIGLDNASGYYDATDAEGAFTEISQILDLEAGGSTIANAGTGGVTKGDLVYFSANNTILPMPINAKHAAAGIALETATVGNEAAILLTNKIVTGILTAATFDTVYYWSGSALTTTQPATSGDYVWKVGSAANETDLLLNIEFVKKNA